MFIKKHTKESLSSDFNFNEIYPHEKGFADFYEKNIKEAYEKAELERLKNLKAFQYRRNKAMSWSILWLLFTALVYQGKFYNFYYNVLVKSYDKALALYHNFWESMPSIIKFITPSKLLYFDFPKPIVLLIIALILINIWWIKLAFKKLPNLYLDVYLKVFKFVDEGFVKQDFAIIQELDFYNYLSLPQYSYIHFDNPILNTKEDHKIEITDVKMYNQPDLQKKKRFISFCGLFITTPVARDSKELVRFVFQESNMANATPEVKQLAEIIFKYNKPHKKDCLDTKIKDIFYNFKNNITKHSVINKIEFASKENMLLGMISINRELFTSKTLFRTLINHDDIRLLLAVCALVKQIKLGL